MQKLEGLSVPQGCNQECHYKLIRLLHCNGSIVKHRFTADKMQDKHTCSMSGKIGLHRFPLFVFRGWPKIICLIKRVTKIYKNNPVHQQILIFKLYSESNDLSRVYC